MIGNLRTFVIVLPELPEVTLKCQQHLRDMRVDDYKPLGEITYFEGIHGEKFGLRTIHPYNLDRTPADGDFFMGPKPVGIYLSHYALWMACTLLPDPHFFIMEADAKFPSDWEPRFTHILQDLPTDLDVGFIGSCCTAGFQSRHVTNEVYEVKYPMCLQAYIVAKKALPDLLHRQRDCYAPIDISMKLHALPHLRTYTVLPRLVEQFNTHLPL